MLRRGEWDYALVSCSLQLSVPTGSGRYAREFNYNVKGISNNPKPLFSDVSIMGRRIGNGSSCLSS